MSKSSTLNMGVAFASAVSFLVVGTTPAFATTATPIPANVEARMELRQENREQRQELRQEIRSERQENAQDRRSRIAENHANRLEQRFGEYYTRLSNIAERLEQRIATLKGQGKDVARAEAALTKAKTTLTEAQKSGAEAVAMFRAIDPAKYTEQRPEALKARDKAQAARQQFVKAMQELQSTAQVIKTVK